MLVVCAVIVNSAGEVLVTQRLPDKEYGGTWEVPGGKVDQLETPEAALFRELQEELGVSGHSIGKLLVTVKCNTMYGATVIQFYAAHLQAGSVPQPLAATSLQWVYAPHLSNYVLTPGTAAALNHIVNHAYNNVAA